jgi:hypothetical protein
MTATDIRRAPPIVAPDMNKNADCRLRRAERCQCQATEKSAASPQHMQRMGNIRSQKTLGRAPGTPIMPAATARYRHIEATSVPTVKRTGRLSRMWLPARFPLLPSGRKCGDAREPTRSSNQPIRFRPSLGNIRADSNDIGGITSTRKIIQLNPLRNSALTRPTTGRNCA